MGSSLYAGISGLNASAKQMDVIGNNIANVNSIGFKAGKIYFSDILSKSVTGGASDVMQVGRGVQVNDVRTEFASGSFETTANATDLSVDGDGFFIVQDQDGGSFYTRAGAFHIDCDGYLVDVNGYKVQGTVGTDTTLMTDISLSGVQSDPAVTTAFSVGANLNAAATTGQLFNVPQTVYDSLGAEHILKMTLQKTEGNGVWGVQCYLDDVEATTQDYYGIQFDTDGALEKIYKGTVGAVTEVTAGDGTATVALDRPGQVSHTGTVLLTRGADAETWAITDPGGYTSATVISADASTVEICLDGTSATVADVTLTLSDTWAEDDTATFTLTGCEAGSGLVTPTDATTAATAVLNNPEKFVAGDNALELTRLADGASPLWSFTDVGVYTSAAILASSDTSITLTLDGTTATDVTLSLTGTYEEDDTLDFSLAAGNGSTTLADVDITLPAIDGATIGTAGVVSWDITGTTAKTLTGYNSASVVSSLSCDGHGSGALKSISVLPTGVLSGFFTNGQTSQIGQIKLADFDNPWGLKREGNNLFSQTVASGDAVTNVPGTSGLGDITPNSLEMSNTDIATEFINMITAQRAYQASAKVITTTDQMMSELMNIKR